MMGHTNYTDWLLSPDLVFAALRLILAALAAYCLRLFLSLKRALRAIESRVETRLTELDAEWKARNDTLEERWRELSQVSGLLVPPAPARSGLNITKRSQALQLSRRGEKPQEIAAALAIPLAEVELLVKVQKIALEASL